jgi:steroid 5-alpha reductase family enzyme
MNLPIAPPAFDATTGPRPRHRADRGADIGAGCALVVLELIALAAIFGLWFLSGIDLDTGTTVGVDPLWGCLTAAGAVGLLTVLAAAVAARAGAVVTVVSQGVMATLVCVIVFGGTAAQSHEDAQCRRTPSVRECDG